MLIIDKLNEKVFAVKDGEESRVVYAEPFFATAIGDQVIIRSQVRKVEHRAPYDEVAINGTTYESAEEAVEGLATFLGNFKRGGGSSPSPTPVYQNKSLSITENGQTTVRPDSGYDALSRIDVSVDVAGGGGVDSSKPVLFFDFDGTLLHSYTIEEAKALTALPAQPTHDLLTGTGWTHTLEQVKAASRALHVGAMYKTTDGKTRAWVTLTAVSGLDLPICFTITGAATIRVDWGDGQTEDATATSTLTHNYASTGNYQITLERIAGTGTYTLGRGTASTTFIGASTAAYKQTLTKVIIEDNVVVGTSAFQNCYSLTSVVIPDGVTSIGGDAFSGCYSLTSVVIPDGVTSIGINAFQNCYSLTSVVIPDGVTSIGTNAFSGCYSLTSVVISDGVTSIGTSAFQNCYSLTSVVIPDGVTSIGTNAFYSCYSLTSVVIPDGVTSIGTNAFSSCYSLNEITLQSETPPSLLNTNAFAGGTSIRKYFVPDASVDAFKTATNWATYADYFYPISSRP